jgi:hypothetical protein
MTNVRSPAPPRPTGGSRDNERSFARTAWTGGEEPG